jgi:hypothetical protein
MYKNNLDSYITGTGDAKSSLKGSSCLDVEDLVKMGRKDNVCPYFYSRDTSAKADLVLLPYNYLLDSAIRNTLKLRWENSIIIFDEAHNLERVSSDASSCAISSVELAACIKELQQVLVILKEMGENSGSMERGDVLAESGGGTGAGSGTGTGGGKNQQGGDAGELGPPRLAMVVEILRGLFNMEKRLDCLLLKKEGLGGGASAVMPGLWLAEWFQQSGLAPAMVTTSSSSRLILILFIYFSSSE